MLFFNGYIVICLSLTLLYAISFLSFLTDYEENRCEMTYMFQFPQFVQIVTPFDYKFKKYGLYAYNEGHFTEKTRNMYFDGIPVLFVPGNAGSHKQVRSFASVALRKALDSKYGFHFDYFTLDLNGELSGLNGILLEEQTDYVNRSLHHILTLYKDRKNPPNSIVVIGHSMGGIIAQYISSKNDGLIPILITLSSPIQRPSIIFDHIMDSYYKNMDYNTINSLTVHLSGGFNDFLVPAYLTKGQGLNVVTTSIPKVWLPTDHLCILWCKQLVLGINRALFESVNSKVKQITQDKSYLKRVFRYHLIRDSGTKTSFSDQRNDVMVDINNAGQWIEKLPRQYTIRLLEGTREQQWHMIGYVNQPKHEYLSIVAINLELSDWTFACSASSVRGNSRVCVQAKHLSHLSEIAPSAKYKRRNFNINMHAFKQRFPNWTHIVAKVPATREPVVLHVDIYNKQERTIAVNLPKLWSISRHNVIKETADKAVSYELKISSLSHIMQSYLLHVEAFNCQNAAHHATASLTVPWNNENVHKYFTETDEMPLRLRLYSSKLPRNLNATVTIKLTLDPTCKYRVSIQTHWLGTLSQMARYYSPLLFANVAAVILMTLRSQLMTMNKNAKCPLFFVAMKEGAKPYYIITSSKLIAKLLGIKNLSKFIPISDWTILYDEGTDFLLLPLILYFVSVGIVWIMSIILTAFMIIFEASAHKLVMKVVTISISGPVNISEWLLKGFHKLPGIIAGILIIVSFTTCGGLALAIGMIFYFFKLTKMSQDFIEELMWKVAKLFIAKLGRMFFKSKRDTRSGEQQQQNLSVTENENSENVTKENEKNQDIEDRLINNTEEGNEKVEEEEEPETSNEEESTDDEDEGLLMKDNIDEESQEDNDAGTSTKKGIIKVEEPSGSNTKEANEQSDDGNQQNTRSWFELLENDEIFFHFTIFLLWCIVTFINVPVVLAWAHNYRYETALTNDPSFVPGMILSLCALALWQLELPKTGRQGYKQLANIVFAVTILTLVFCTISVYRLNYLLSSLIAIIVLHQLLAPNKDNNMSAQAERNEEFNNVGNVFEQIKAKWE